MVLHLRKEHDILMPDADVIPKGRSTKDPLGTVDPAVALIVVRLTKALNLLPQEMSTA
jgi:hypothetical protein